MNLNNTPEYKKEFSNALKEAVDEIVSIDRDTLTSLLKERENNDVSQFIVEMGVLNAGEQEAKAAPAYEVFNDQLVNVSFKDFDVEKFIFVFVMILVMSSKFRVKKNVSYTGDCRWNDELPPDYKMATVTPVVSKLKLISYKTEEQSYTTKQYEEIALAA